MIEGGYKNVLRMDYSARYSTRNSPIRNREDCVLVFVSNFFFFSNCTLVASRFFFIRIVQREGKQSESEITGEWYTCVNDDQTNDINDSNVR